MILPFGFVVLITLVLAWLALAYRISNLLLYARRQPIVCTPADVGLCYEDVAFASQDRLGLKGWWIPVANSTEPLVRAPAVILLHPLFGNRHGFTRQQQRWPSLFDMVDLELDLLQLAKTFHQAGYAVLMFDFRSHGESQRGLCTGGMTEDQDVMGAVDYVFARLMAESSVGKSPSEKTFTEKPSVGIVGFGLGAAAAFAAVGREKGGTEILHVFSGDSAGGSGFVAIHPPNVKYLRFLVAVEPTSLTMLLRDYLRQYTSLLGWMLIPLVDCLYHWRSGYPLTVKPLLKFVREVNIPVLYVRANSRVRDASPESQTIYDALPAHKQCWWLDETREAFAEYQAVAAHPAPMLAFAAQHTAVAQP